jgi:hypothetical protein
MYVKRAVKENSAFDVNALMSDLSAGRLISCVTVTGKTNYFAFFS